MKAVFTSTTRETVAEVGPLKVMVDQEQSSWARRDSR